MRTFDLVSIRTGMIGKDFEKSKEFVSFIDAVKRVAGGDISIEKTEQMIIVWQTVKPAKKNGKGE